MSEKLKKWLLAIVLIIAVALGLPLEEILPNLPGEPVGYEYMLQAAPEGEPLQPVTAYEVYDGDTIHFTLGGPYPKQIKARILMIDAPELQPKQAYGVAAKKRVEQLLAQADKIAIQYEGERTDRYGRALVHVWVDSLLLQEILVSEGYAIARYIHHYPIRNGRYVEAIFAAQAYARYQQFGVWYDGNPDFLSHAEESKR